MTNRLYSSLDERWGSGHAIAQHADLAAAHALGGEQTSGLKWKTIVAKFYAPRAANKAAMVML